MLLHQGPKSSVFEGFRALRSNLNFLNKSNDHKTYLVTSSVSGEGKTYVAENLAIVFARSGKKTLVVGSDLRRPKIYDDFGLENTIGISNHILSDKIVNEIIVHSEIENLDILISGPIPNNPSDILVAEKFANMMLELKKKYDVIIIADAAKNQEKNELTQILPNSRVILPSEAYLSAEKIKGVLSKTQENWVILESSNIGLISSTTSALNRLAREHQIKLFTTNRNSGFEDDVVDNEHLGRLNFHYPSVDKQYDDMMTEAFIEDYKEQFNMIPNQYVVRGYDLTLDILLRLASAEDLYDSFEKYTGFTEYHENKFHYNSKRNGGFYNDAVYIMSLDEELNLKVANDQ